MDVQNPFVFLHEGIPSWFTNVAEIEARVASLQAEITRVPVATAPNLKKKSTSTESIQIDEENGIGTSQQEDGTSAAVTRPTQLQLIKRKRKPGSVLSSHASGPLKYRSRAMVIIYYDSEVQKLFEALVRCIGTGRNLLRKGKMAAKMEALAEMASAMDDDDEGDSDPMAKIGYRPRPSGLPNFRSTRRMGGPGGPAGGDSGAKFDAADKALEKAQSLCEHGAHQFLRDGECRTELNAVREYFTEVLKLCERELATHNNVVKPQRSEEFQPKPAQLPIERTPIAPKAIEVDDADDGEDWVLPPIRRTTRV